MLYEQRQRAARAASVAGVIGEATTLRDLAWAEPGDVARWQVALAAVRQAEGLTGGDAEALRQLAALGDEVRAGAEAAERDRALLDKIVDIRSARADDPDGIQTEAAYAKAFREAGFDLLVMSPADAEAKIRARPPGLALTLAAALDDCSALRRGARKDEAGAGRLAEVARLADPDPWRNSLRAAFALGAREGRKQALQALVGTAKFDELGAVSLDLLSKALADEGDVTTAERVLRRAQAHHSGDVWVNYDLARLLERLHRRDEAIRFYTAARALRPETAHELAHALASRGETDEAIEVFRDLTRLRPSVGRHHGCLGTELKQHGRPEEAAAILELAAAEYREAIRLQPDDALTHCNLGHLLRIRGDYAGALAMLRKGHELGTKLPDWRYPSAAWVAGAERLVGQVDRLPALMKGEDLPKDVAEALDVAQLCYDTRRHAAAARLWAEALEADPKLGDDLQAQHRYNAACAAAQAGAGQGRDDPPPAAAAKAKLRGQALGWLQVELAAWAKVLEAGPDPTKTLVAATLQHWKADADLAGIREADALTKLPEAERQGWRALWVEVDALLARAKP